MIAHPPFHRWQRGLTLLELLVAMAVFSVVMIAIAATMSTMQSTWMRLREKTDEYRGTRMALDTMARRLSQATLMSRWKRDPDAAPNADQYVRDSDLHFVCGPSEDLLGGGTFSGDAVFFQGPFGENSGASTTGPRYDALNNVICAWGYFVEYDTDEKGVLPKIRKEQQTRVPPRMRFRLMEFRQPAHELDVFHLDTKDKRSSALALAGTQTSVYEWFHRPITSDAPRERHVSVVAENILAVAVLAMNPETTPDPDERIDADDGIYDSRRFQWQKNRKLSNVTRHRLPPVLRMSAIAMSEDAWQKLSEGETNSVAAQLRNQLSGRFRDPTKFDADLRDMDTLLTQLKMPHKIITENIRMSEQ